MGDFVGENESMIHLFTVHDGLNEFKLLYNTEDGCLRIMKNNKPVTNLSAYVIRHYNLNLRVKKQFFTVDIDQPMPILGKTINEIYKKIFDHYGIAVQIVISKKQKSVNIHPKTDQDKAKLLFYFNHLIEKSG